MSDPIEAAWSAYAKAMDHTGPTVAEENAIRLALDAYHAAAPSNYAALKEALRAYEQLDEEGIFVKVSRQACEEGHDAIEALEAQKEIAINTASELLQRASERLQRAEAAEAELRATEKALASTTEHLTRESNERDKLKARVALLEETLSAIVDEVMDGDIVSAEQIARAAGLAALEKDDG